MSILYVLLPNINFIDIALECPYIKALIQVKIK